VPAALAALVSAAAAVPVGASPSSPAALALFSAARGLACAVLASSSSAFVPAAASVPLLPSLPSASSLVLAASLSSLVPSPGVALGLSALGFVAASLSAAGYPAAASALRPGPAPVSAALLASLSAPSVPPPLQPRLF
jgi:hypothetical protein